MMTREEFVALAGAQRAQGIERFAIPVYKRLSADLLTPVSALLALRRFGSHTFLLESVEGGEKLARYSFLGKNPYRIVRREGSGITVTDGQGQPEADISHSDIYAVLQSYLDAYVEVAVPGLPRLTCGAVGYLGYDNVRLIEELPDQPEDDLGLPDAIWCFYDAVVAFDHVKHQLVLMASAFVDATSDVESCYRAATAALDRLKDELHEPYESPEAVTLDMQEMRSNFATSAFEDAVREAKRLIYEGDIFQVVLSQRFTMSFGGDAFNLYRALRQINPSPYLFYLDFDGVILIGSSPEVLVRIVEGEAQLLPIAGTRPRGASPEEDETLANDLLADPKERAEHLMLVDLGRNDLGRVCQIDTVTVERYAYIERYSHVMHIVTSLSGNVHARYRAMDVLKACFPAGTVSGAPKVRAMEIIDALEPTKRNIYAGAVGYVDFSGNMDTCIAIRTMVIHNRDIYIQAGAGIVADSDPTRERIETENKARALKQALLVAAEGLL